ncbi:MAG: transcriptional coactivator p15/PC4 family protein [Deltaproteobacteria bacterium]|nr:transcriptional coactivator p15/PC4 family protein [Deltaproteobacteria bacterium]MBW2068815.1 transcriptional coactivator p15/PC4 family protein [Deltaproteobacteria bacterium]
MATEPKVVYSFQKNALEEVRASVTTFKGKNYLDIRVYYKADDGEFKPSRKGITLATSLIDDLEEAVKKLREALDEAG